MADNKYKKSLDRQAVLFDKQNRIIDLTDFSPVLPDVGIYDEPTRTFKANLEWCKLIFGWLAWMQDEAFWPESEGQDYAGIQAILIFEQGIEASGMASEDDIAKGLYKAVNWMALQLATGVYQNVNLATDSSGVVIPPSAAGADLPDDDPTTVINETFAAKMGGAQEVAALFENVLERIDTLYGATNGTPVYTAANAEIVMNQFYGFDPVLINAAITQYYSYRATNPRFLWVKVISFAQFLYCNGMTAVAAARYLIDVIGFTFVKQDAMLKFWFALLQSAIDEAYVLGTSKPSTLYLDAYCVPSPTEIMNMPVLGTTYTTQTFWKNNHRLLVTVENYFTDSVDGDIVDFWWYKTTAGTPVSRIAANNVTLGTGVSKPTTNQVPYSSTHKYQFTIDTPAAAGVMQLTIAGTSITTPVASVTGVGFKVTIQDLGDYTL